MTTTSNGARSAMAPAGDRLDPGTLSLFSANCHFLEPRHTFEGRLPRHLQDRAPKLVDAPGYGEQWVFEGETRILSRNCAVAGIPKEEWAPSTGTDLVRLEDVRAGCYDPVARLADMDADGVIAAVCSSSPATMGFGCDLFARTDDPELGIATMRAWNDWVIEEWVAADPDRFVPIQATWYRDPVVAAAEVRRNAERGFKGVTFRNPTDLDEPTIASGHWDPFLRACEETGTVLYHHTDDQAHWRNPGQPYAFCSILFQFAAAETVLHWIWGGLSTRFPNLRVTVGESGGSWIPHLLKRMDWSLGFSPAHAEGWPEPGATPLELLKRSFVFSTFEVDTAVALQDEFGIEGWMFESDYPHFESFWPNSREHFARELAHLSPARVREFTWENVSRLYRHEVPAALQTPRVEQTV